YDDFLFLQEGLSGLITSNRKGGKGGDDVYNFTIDTTPYKICIELINSDSPLIGINNTPLEISYQNRQLNLLSDDGGKACFSISAIDAFVNPSQSLSINIKKSGFESITQQMHSLILSSENKNITLNQPLKPIKVIMPPVVKIKIGQDLGKLLNLNPIYFDLGKWDVRPDAAIELDKIVKAMQEFPGLIIELGSHTDSRASAKFNQTLSQ
ncbi:MAG: OmpA family protein, partial [Bacteroidota bacterium]